MSGKEVPKYLRLKREISSWIESGSLKPGDLMPSENEIAERFGMSRQTVRQTLGVLEQEGRLYRVQGKGTFVANPAVQQDREVQTIGMLTTYISDYIFPHIVRGAESALRQRGYRLLLSSTDNDKEKERESLAMLMSQPLSGLIVEPTRSAEGNPNLSYYLSLDFRSIPYLMINERYADAACPCLKLDDEEGGFLAAEHLIRLGHRRIAGFFKTDDLQGVNRMKGFIRAHRKYQVPLRPEWVIDYGTVQKRDKPLTMAAELLAPPAADRPTAFVCYNDELAVQLLEPIRAGGFAIPGDLSLVGFDDSMLATATEVKLTSIAHPKEAMGEAAALQLLDMIEQGGGTRVYPDVVYKPELIVRSSTGPVPGTATVSEM